MENKPNHLHKSVIVVAHPDDEILWFSSIIEQADKVIIVYKDYWAHPDIGEQRERAISKIPHPNVVCLNIPEAGTYGCADWENAQYTPYGIHLGRRAAIRDFKNSIKAALNKFTSKNYPLPDQNIETLYKSNFFRLETALKQELAGYENVFTHNPWGEYGHEDHIQVYKAVKSVKAVHGYKQWMSNYCTQRSLSLAMRFFKTHDLDYVCMKTNPKFANSIANIYRKHDCWTWSDDWRWFKDECFAEVPDEESALIDQAHLFPLNMFKI